MAVLRTTGCGQVTGTFLDKVIHLAGWVHKRRDHGGLIFIDLRDRTGIMQLVFNPAIDTNVHAIAHSLRSEFVIAVSGLVILRAPGTVNDKLATGKWELQVQQLTILNSAKALPFSLDDAEAVEDDLKLKYRYLDLRRPVMHDRMKLRNDVTFAIREFFQRKAFYEIETPILTKGTAEGAREFFVPSRMHHGSIYVLPQSPQLYKQLLMASGMEKYFQIARCFRDEDLRADRQLEFTQLDLEMSFTDQEQIIVLVDELIGLRWKLFLNIDLQLPLARMTYDEGFARFGSDKPDLRFDFEIKDATPLFEGTDLRFVKQVLEDGGKVGAIHVDRQFTRAELDGWVASAQQLGASGLLWIWFGEDGAVHSPVAKFLPAHFFEQAKALIPGLEKNHTLFLIAGKYEAAWTLLGRLRLEIGKALGLMQLDNYKFVWITDFPFFEWDEERKRWASARHPFTMPQGDWQQQGPQQVRTHSYDIVLNGIELGGGSIRIHDPLMQLRIFELLNMPEELARKHFGFLLEAQELGFPPHGGIALGLDRLIMLMARAHSIREVIAFPKTSRGMGPLMGAPAPIDPATLREYGLMLKPTAKKE